MADLTVTVLGSSGTYAGRGRACSSYLAVSDDARLLLDCGNGSLANLTRVCDVTDLDAVLISHLHPDHFADLYGLYYALRLHPSGPQSVDVHAPAGALERVSRLLYDDGQFGRCLRFQEARAGERLRIGPFDVALHAAAHPIETLASRVTAGGRTLAFTGDSGPTDRLVPAARDADLLISDATWLESEGPHPADLHMSGADAGRLAARAGCARLLVTHVFPTTDPGDVAEEAAAHFDGEVLVAEDMEEYRL